MHAARSLIGTVVVVALVAACGSTPPTAAPSVAAPSASSVASAAPSSAAPSASPAATPAPSPTATAAPSPSAVADVAAAFNKSLVDPLWSPHITVKAVSTYGGQTIPITGTIDVNLGTSHTVVAYGQGSSGSTQETISNGSVKYVRRYGVWFKETSSGGSLGGLVTGTTGFTDAGVEAKNGQQLHHMVLPAGTPVPVDSLGVPAGATNVQAGMEAWADADGKPVVIAVTAGWDQPTTGGSTPLSIAMELNIEGSAATITTPTEDEVWAWKTSTINHYLIAYPSTWEYTKGTSKKADYFDGYDGSFFGVARLSAQGLSLNQIITYARTHLKTWSGLTNPKVAKASAARLNGVTARLLVIKGTYQGVTKTQYDIVAVKGKYFYEVFLSMPRQPTAADLALWTTLMATYKMK